jgi:hypothetical protein
MKKSFILYQDYEQHIDLLTDEQAGKLLKAIFKFNAGNVPELDPVVQMAFSFIKSNLERDNGKYASIIERNKNNGLKGGRPKIPETQNNPNNPVGFLGTQNNPEEPKKADTDTDTDTDIGIENEKERKKETPLTPLTPQGGKETVEDFDSVVEPPVKKKPRKQKPPESPLVIPDHIPEAALNAFFANRAIMKKPMTAHAKELLINKITELYHKGHDPTKLIERAILSAWLTVYESNETLTDGVKNEPFQQSNARNYPQSKPSFQQERDRQQAINLQFIADLKRKAAAEERAAEMGSKG